MFERRLKIFLAALLCITFGLLLRAGQVQVIERKNWQAQAEEAMQRFRPIETFRGSILDVRGRVVATDQPCVDACVDYRAIAPQADERWVLELARARLRDRASTANAPRAQQVQMRAREVEAVKNDIKTMWAKLAAAGGMSGEAMDELRRAVVHKVEMRRRYVWYRNYELAMKKHDLREPAAAWRKWLIDDTQNAPELDDFEVTVAEQTEPHVILRAVNLATQNELGKHIERYPGLVLREGTHRFYPYGEAACHVLGRLSRVTREDLAADPNVGVNDLRQYDPNELIGRTGIEALCEPTLRGSRGRIALRANDKAELSRTDAIPGGDVHMTIDIELQEEIRLAFMSVQFKDHDVVDTVPMHGAAVVIDVKSGEVRALVSHPAYDANRFDELYPQLVKNTLDKPLLNRATQSQLEPGSTVKPMVGLAGKTTGLLGMDETIECTGYLTLNGRTYSRGRCWVASKFHDVLCGPDCRLLPCPRVAHHPVPSAAPHPTGMLTFADALERSCNPFFETVADRLGIDGLTEWYGKFGLGRETGLGIAESRGRLPSSYVGNQRSFATWSAGIGQGPIAATPIQMANVAATIARDGIWKRPRLVSGAVVPASAEADTVDLHLNPQAVKQAKDGMSRVVNSRAGTGTAVARKDVAIEGKTGTAQASRLRRPPQVGEDGRIVLGEDGKPRPDFLMPSSHLEPNPDAPWYRGTGRDGKDLSHAWYIGFAPAENPQIAFAVLVEYGGSGGQAAGGVARDLLEACIERGYLSVNGAAPASADQ